ncbi:hypothetical protein WJX74_001138 [Apatococcus lobatus]|uniref:Uncharacterized protein n=1 Tax=Apatococcus lobatus TaxID=904363 RepID=A0AAW1QVH2_9CHLO
MRSQPLLLHRELTKLGGLTSLTLCRRWQACYNVGHTDEYAAVAMPNLTGVVTSLQGLHILDLSGVADSIPAGFSSLKQLRMLCISGFDQDGAAFTISPDFAACSKLESLVLDGLTWASADTFVQICSTLCHLPALSRLEVIGPDLPGTDLAACSFNSNLVHLTLDCALPLLPPGVLGLTKLTYLLFAQAESTGSGVPAVGPYLQSLTDITLWASPSKLDSEFLAAAPKLLHVNLEEDGVIDIPNEAIKSLLGRLPAGGSISWNDLDFDRPSS